MYAKRTTKELLCDSIIDLLNRKSVKDITVREITENCGVSARSFYNHFKDREDLLYYVCRVTLLDTIRNTPLDAPLYDSLVSVITYIFEYASVVDAAMQYDGQNNIFDASIEGMKEILTDRICRITRTDLLDEKMAYAISFWVNGFYSAGKELLSGNTSLTAKEVVDMVIYATPDCLLPYFK